MACLRIRSFVNNGKYAMFRVCASIRDFRDHKIMFTHKRSCHKKILLCLSCGKSVGENSLLCSNCSTANLKALDYFKIFDIERSFHIDQALLQKTFRKKQFELHPDKFANNNADEKDISSYYSSLLNQAYAILQSPLTVISAINRNKK